MPYSLRRVVGVLTAVAALGFAARLHTAFAQPQQPVGIAITFPNAGFTLDGWPIPAAPTRLRSICPRTPSALRRDRSRS